ncbi:MAG: histidine triad nucleotide-binding protein [Coriobacteriales bacterium]|jgi:histidine triad (HIT) family protein|nr:histidine triad nucleotide-binding protein [Coriobacteriales bacterium]
MSDCIFCKIAAGEISSKLVYEDDRVIAFEDINPQLPVHVLVIPKDHYDHIGDDVPEDLMGHLITVAAKVAAIKGVDKTGYRLITNIGEDGRQTVIHLHLHVLGGAKMPLRMGPAD